MHSNVGITANKQFNSNGLLKG